MRPTLRLGLSPHLTMTPQLQQSIRLLQLSSLELESEIQSVLESNPLLEENEKEDKPLENESEYLFSQNHFKTTNEHFSKENASEYPFEKHSDLTLQQHLLWQMELSKFSNTEFAIARTIIDAISEEGYLIVPLTEIQESLEFRATIPEIEAVLYRIQQFDPLGIGSRNLAECLTIQLNHLPSKTLYLESAKLLAANYLELLGKKNYKLLQIKLNIKPSQLKEIIKLLQSLNPKPGTQFLSKKTDYLTPDVIAFKKNGTLFVQLNPEILPKVQINTHYTSLIKKKATKQEESGKYLKAQFKEATAFIKGIEIRNETLLKVAKVIIEKQIDFFEQGEQSIRPLNLQDIAKIVDLHESTISRITNKKYILTPRGIFELKYFFSNALPTSGKDTSAMAVRTRIKKIIAEESSQTPLSDHRIKELLRAEGVEVARRTVTKYREALKIPSSNERKHLGLNLL